MQLAPSKNWSGEELLTTHQQLRAEVSNLITRMNLDPVLAPFVVGVDCCVYELAPVGTACISGNLCRIDPRFWAELSRAQKVGLLVHESEHNKRLHPFRFRGAIHSKANEAGDYSINDLIVELSKHSDLIALPPGGLLDDKYKDMVEEAIYNKLLSEPEPPKPPPPPPGDEPCDDGDPGEQPGDGDTGGAPSEDEEDEEGSDGGGGGMPGDGGEEKEEETGSGGGAPDEENKEDEGGSGYKSPGEFEIADDLADATPEEKQAQQDLIDQWTEIQATTLQTAKLSGKFPSNLLEKLDPSVAVVPWKQRLRNFTRSLRKAGISMTNYDRRYMSEGLYIEDSVVPAVDDIVFVKDTSGSMLSDWCAKGCTEIQSAMEQCGIRRVWVLDVDADIHGNIDGEVQQYGPGDRIDFSAKGRGGTDFRPAFKWAEEQCPVVPKALIYFTDGWGPFPDKAPAFPVMWATFGLEPEKYPFGEVIDMRSVI